MSLSDPYFYIDTAGFQAAIAAGFPIEVISVHGSYQPTSFRYTLDGKTFVAHAQDTEAVRALGSQTAADALRTGLTFYGVTYSEKTHAQAVADMDTADWSIDSGA